MRLALGCVFGEIGLPAPAPPFPVAPVSRPSLGRWGDHRLGPLLLNLSFPPIHNSTRPRLVHPLSLLDPV